MAAATPAQTDTHVEVDGKFFSAAGRRFPVRGVTYGTFAARPGDGARFPELAGMKRDLVDISDAGFTVVRTYTEPPSDFLDILADCDLKVMAGVFWSDWRYLLGSSRRQAAEVERDAQRTVEQAARRLAADPRVFALCLGNEIPADVVRWVGADHVAGVIERLVDTVKAVDDSRLVTYGNYPTTEYLPLGSLDFLTYNVFLERQLDFASYLTRLHHQAGQRPLVLGELGSHAGDDPAGERRQSEVLDWQLETAVERGVAGTFCFSWTDEWHVADVAVEGWHFGLTRADRSPRLALDTAAQRNAMTVADLKRHWPSMSVVICAYNSAATLDECLRHTCSLDYPLLEIVVVDDGSTDDTATIAQRYPRVRLITIEHAGLSVARNEGFAAARGEIVAYLDSDAYPTPEWPYYLALGFDGRDVVGSGGPNVPPPDDPRGAQIVARSPGGPVHVLTADNRAEHIPGCNMAFWKYALEEVGGFDPIYTAAGDDVDLCWKMLDRQWDIGFHPAALVWHHRRPGLRAYLRQQRGYGRAEALVEARHPDRFTRTGSARWSGRIYNPTVAGVIAGPQRIYRGLFGSAPYQSVYQAGGHGKDLAFQLGAPVSVVLLPTALAGVAHPWAAGPALLAALTLLVLFITALVHAEPPRHLRTGRVRFRAAVAVHHVLQPLVRSWARSRHRQSARDRDGSHCIPGPVREGSRGVLVLPATQPREEVVTAMVAPLRKAGLRLLGSTGWEPYDLRVLGSWTLAGDVLTSAHPQGCIQVTIRRRVRVPAALAAATTMLAGAMLHPVAGLVVMIAVAVDVVRGRHRSAVVVRRVICQAGHP